MNQLSKPARGPFLTIMAFAFAMLAISNVTKVLQHLANPNHLGIVIFGFRFESAATNLIFGPLMGVVIGTYAYGLWKLKPWVKPLSIAYAFYVPTNLVLFWFAQTGPNTHSVAGIVVYLAVAYTGSIGTALYIAYHPEKFRLASST